MTQEQKAKAYDEVVEKAKTEKEKSRNLGLLEFIDESFPELKESEDEKIRQFLIQQVTETSDEIMSYRNMNKEDVLAWLEKQGEKQGEQKPVEPQQDMLSQEKYAKAVDECIYGEQKPVNVDYVSGIREELLSIEDSAENIVGLAESQWVAIRAAHRLLGEYIAKEQKLADKVEPKFKIGEVAVYDC